MNNSHRMPGIQNLNESYNESESQINNDIERHPSTRISQMDSEKPFINKSAAQPKQKHNLKVPDLSKLTGRGPNSILEGQPNICDARFEPMQINLERVSKFKNTKASTTFKTISSRTELWGPALP